VCDSGRDDNSACVTAGGMTIVCVTAGGMTIVRVTVGGMTIVRVTVGGMTVMRVKYLLFACEKLILTSEIKCCGRGASGFAG
jgi:hypothetical protein